MGPGNAASGRDSLPTNFTENPRIHPLAGAWPHRSGLAGILGDLRVSGTSAAERTEGGAGPLGLTTQNSIHADAGYRYLPNEVGRCRRTWRIVLHLRLELGVAECPLEVLDRFR